MTDHADLTARLRDAADKSETGGGEWYQLIHRCREAADALDAADAENARLQVERDELHDDVVTVLRVRNAALLQAASHFHHGPDGADDRERQRLIEAWVEDGHEQVAEENRQRTQMLARMIQAERERDEALAEVARLRDERQAVIDCLNLYGDEIIHDALDAIGFAPRAVSEEATDV